MITIKAAAKINLFLEVIDKRRDGYHNINSLLLPISLYDTIRIDDHARVMCSALPANCRFRGIPWALSMGSTSENLIIRAAEALKKRTGCKKGAKISLTKRIPIGAGLGGGSADAAAVLTGLNRLWETGLSKAQLMEVGARIGCDVPALVHGGAARMAGRGEIVSPLTGLALRDIHILLVYPGFAISTCDIYHRYDDYHGRSPARSAVKSKFQSVLAGLQAGASGLIGRGMFNALQETVFCKYPLLEMIKNSLEQAGAEHVLLTGSGSTVFALLKKRNEGDRTAEMLRKKIGSPLWTQVVHAIGERDRLG